MTPVVVGEIEDLITLGRRTPDTGRAGGEISLRPRAAREAPAPAYGPMTGKVVALLERAATLGADDMTRLAIDAGAMRRTTSYTDALLAMRRAAEAAGRDAVARRAGSRAEWIVVQHAEEVSRTEPDDCARWSIMAQEAGWAASDAAQALVVGDLLDDAHLRVLTRAWTAVSDRRPG